MHLHRHQDDHPPTLTTTPTPTLKLTHSSAHRASVAYTGCGGVPHHIVQERHLAFGHVHARAVAQRRHAQPLRRLPVALHARMHALRSAAKSWGVAKPGGDRACMHAVVHGQVKGGLLSLEVTVHPCAATLPHCASCRGTGLGMQCTIAFMPLPGTCCSRSPCSASLACSSGLWR